MSAWCSASQEAAEPSPCQAAQPDPKIQDPGPISTTAEKEERLPFSGGWNPAQTSARERMPVAISTLHKQYLKPPAQLLVDAQVVGEVGGLSLHFLLKHLPPIHALCPRSFAPPHECFAPQQAEPQLAVSV